MHPERACSQSAWVSWGRHVAQTAYFAHAAQNRVLVGHAGASVMPDAVNASSIVVPSADAASEKSTRGSVLAHAFAAVARAYAELVEHWDAVASHVHCESPFSHVDWSEDLVPHTCAK